VEVYVEDEPRPGPERRRWRALVASVAVIAFLAALSALPGTGAPQIAIVTGGGGDPRAGSGGPQPSSPSRAAPSSPPAAGVAAAPAGTVAAGTSPGPSTASSPPVASGAGGVSAAGPSPAGPEVAAGQTPSCGPDACVTVDATLPSSTFAPTGSGLSDGVQAGDGGDYSAMQALGVSIYRGAPTLGLLDSYDWSDWDTAARYAKATSLVLSNIYQEQYVPYPPTPWSNWSRYKNWLTQTVHNVLSSGRQPTYWEIFNEPGWPGYYSPSAYATMTPADLLQQFLVSYQIIKGIDANAQIVGPSTGLWSLTPLPAGAGNHEFDLGTFLHFAAANHLHLAAIGWHENGATPTRLETEAAATEALIRSLPSLGDPPMILQEYAAQSTQPIPGWDVAYLAAIGQSGFESAGRSCWSNDCGDGALDGLLTSYGLAQTAEYWERLFYAQMTGRTIPVTSSDPNLAGLGTVDTAGQRISVLLGRDASCAQQSWCDAEFPAGSRPAPAVPAVVRVHVPWTSPAASVQLGTIGFQVGLDPEPPVPVSVGDAVVTPALGGGEWVTFPIPAWADGTAYTLTVSG
jgi:hypothetical protein